ncbi:hypothetical protein J3A83DRAFT_968767 [Scleroderma citrinum]
MLQNRKVGSKNWERIEPRNPLQLLYLLTATLQPTIALTQLVPDRPNQNIPSLTETSRKTTPVHAPFPLHCSAPRHPKSVNAGVPGPVEVNRATACSRLTYRRRPVVVSFGARRTKDTRQHCMDSIGLRIDKPLSGSRTVLVGDLRRDTEGKNFSRFKWTGVRVALTFSHSNGSSNQAQETFTSVQSREISVAN